MLGRYYGGQICSAARALEIVGERWSLLIVRDAMFAGVTRFVEFQRRLGVAPNILTNRLNGFVEAGVFEPRGQAGSRAEYVLTEKGWDLQPVILALTMWGDRWAAPGGAPITYVHDKCPGPVSVETTCTTCGTQLPATDVRAELDPRFCELAPGTRK